MFQNNEELDILDIITVLSFALQLQNRESHKIDSLRDEVSKRLDGQIKVQLDRIEDKVDKILSYLGI